MLTTVIRSMLIFALPYAVSPTRAQDDAELKQQGQVLLANNCARCHAIASTGSSPHKEAPPFRTLGQKYPVDYLAERSGKVSPPAIPTCRNSCSSQARSTRS